MKKYRLYIDESGNSDLGSSDNPNHRYLSLTGVAIDLEYVRSTIHPDMETLKDKFFISHPDDPVIFHRKEMMNAKTPFRALNNQEIRNKFNEALLTLLIHWDYTVFTVCIDKKNHKDTYSTWKYDPYHYCLKILMERFNFWLRRKQGVGDMLAESRGGREDIRLKKSYEKLWRDGTEYIEASEFQRTLTSKQLKVKPKTANISGLQLADLLAHPSKAEILYEEGVADQPAPFAQLIINILKDKYDSKDGKSVGKKFL